MPSALARGTRRIAPRICITCLAVGAALCLYASAAVAQTLAGASPDWSAVATGALGIITLLIGAFAKGISSRLDRAETDISSNRDLLIREYQSKADGERAIQASIAVIRAEITSMTRSIEALSHGIERLREHR